MVDRILIKYLFINYLLKNNFALVPPKSKFQYFFETGSCYLRFSSYLCSPFCGTKPAKRLKNKQNRFQPCLE